MPKYEGKQKYPRTKKERDETNENNCQLRIHRSCLDLNVSENNGQLRFRPPPQVEHASRLHQKENQWKQWPASPPRKAPGPTYFQIMLSTTPLFHQLYLSDWPHVSACCAWSSYIKNQEKCSWVPQTNLRFFTVTKIYSHRMYNIGQGGLRAPSVIVCAMHSLAIVITIVQSFFLFSVFCFWPTSGNLPCAKICFPQYFGITRRYMQKKIFF